MRKSKVSCFNSLDLIAYIPLEGFISGTLFIGHIPLEGFSTGYLIGLYSCPWGREGYVLGTLFIGYILSKVLILVTSYF